MNDYEKLERARTDLDYALHFVPKEFHDPNFMDTTCWEAYLSGLILNSLWSQVNEDGTIRIVENSSGRRTLVEKYFPYAVVLDETSKTRPEPERSRILAYDAAVWAVRADDTMDYYRQLKKEQKDLLNTNSNLSCFVWVIRIIASLFLTAYYDRLGGFSSSVLGFLSKPFEYLIWILLWLVLWAPVFLAFKSPKNNKYKAQAEEIEEQCEEVLRVYHFFKGMQNEIPFIDARRRIGADIDGDALVRIVNLIDQGRARNLAEAQNIYEEDKRAWLMSNQYEELQRKLDYNNTMTTINAVANIIKRK